MLSNAILPASDPERIRRYTVIVDTLMASATSRTVRRRCSSSTGVTFGCRTNSRATIVNTGTSLKACSAEFRRTCGDAGAAGPCDSATEPCHQLTIGSPKSTKIIVPGGQKRPEGDVLLAARGARRRSAPSRSLRPSRNPRNNPPNTYRPAQPTEEQPEHEREADVAESHPARRDEVQDEEERERADRAEQRPPERRPSSCSSAAPRPRAGSRRRCPTGYTIRFGMMKCSRSIAEIAISAAVNTRNAGSAHESGSAAPTAAKSTAGEQLDERIANRDRLAAVAAPARAAATTTRPGCCRAARSAHRNRGNANAA